MIVKNSVLLLKVQSKEGKDDQYERLLKSKKFNVCSVRTLDFVYYNLDLLENKLKECDNYSGLIFSSPRCVDAVHQANKGQTIMKNWKTKHNFVVGESTYKEVLEKLDLECKGKETGNASSLAEYIIMGRPRYTKPFLFPHGNLKTDTLKFELEKNDLSLEGVLVYNTIPNPLLEDDFAKATNNFMSISEYVVFFSPSGVRNSIPFLKRLSIIDLNEIKFIAIGPVTEEAIKSENLQVYKTARKPTPDDVLSAVEDS